jgi:hypothetical protein
MHAACGFRGTYSPRLPMRRRYGVRDGEMLISDGLVVEAKEPIAGFSLLDCADLDEALEVASKNPGATFGTLELRPFDES